MEDHTRKQSSCCGRGHERAALAARGSALNEERAAQEGVRSQEKRSRHAAREVGIERARLVAVSLPPGSREEHIRTSPPPPSRRKSRGSAAAPRRCRSTAGLAGKSVATPRRCQRRRAAAPRRRCPTVRGSRRSVAAPRRRHPAAGGEGGERLRLAVATPPSKEQGESGRASPPSPRRRRSRKNRCHHRSASEGSGRERPNLAAIAPSPEEPGGERQRLVATVPTPEEPGQSGHALVASPRHRRSQEESHRGSPLSPHSGKHCFF